MSQRMYTYVSHTTHMKNSQPQEEALEPAQKTPSQKHKPWNPHEKCVGIDLENIRQLNSSSKPYLVPFII